jgi:hypothetical protein
VNRHVLWLPLFVAAVAVPPLLAVPEPSADELKDNRIQLAQLRKNPERLTQLRSNLRAFLALPTERREQILRLDDALKQDKAEPRLVHVLERYASWLERLSESDRRQIAGQSDKDLRVALIQTLRDREWVLKQPEEVRKKWTALAAPAQSALVRQLRKEERDRQNEWRIATHLWKRVNGPRPPPTRISELDIADREGVEQFLWPLLSDAEKGQLKAAEGQWSRFLVKLVELADRHPLALAGKSGPRFFNELPEPVRQKLAEPHNRAGGNPIIFANQVRHHEKKEWPALGAAVVLVYQRNLKTRLPHELWAFSYVCLEPPMQQYVDRLKEKLSDEEKKLLADVTNQKHAWPAYPIAIHKLGEAHQMGPPPWNTALSGPRERWDDVRTLNHSSAQAVSPELVEHFAHFTLEEPKKRADMSKLAPVVRLLQSAAKYQAQHGPWKVPHFESHDKGKGHSFGHARR